MEKPADPSQNTGRTLAERYLRERESKALTMLFRERLKEQEALISWDNSTPCCCQEKPLALRMYDDGAFLLLRAWTFALVGLGPRDPCRRRLLSEPFLLLEGGRLVAGVCAFHSLALASSSTSPPLGQNQVPNTRTGLWDKCPTLQL